MHDSVEQNSEQGYSVPEAQMMAQPKQELPQVAWLCNRKNQHRRSLKLARLFDDDGIKICVMDSERRLPEHMLSFDLIILEMNRWDLEDLTHVLRTIRMKCHVPLLVMLPHRAAECTLETLEAGADAAITMAAPAEVIFARSKALLRRWQPHTKSTSVL